MKARPCDDCAPLKGAQGQEDKEASYTDNTLTEAHFPIPPDVKKKKKKTTCSGVNSHQAFIAPVDK